MFEASIRRRRAARFALALASCALVACEKDAPQPKKPDPTPTAHAATALPAPAGPTITVSAVGPGTVNEGDALTLVGTAACSNGAQVSYSWRQVGAGPRAEFKTPYAATTTIKAPESNANYDLQFELQASAPGATDASSSVTVHVAADDDPPTAEAFVPAPAECGELVALVGQGRSAESNQPLHFLWKQVGEGPQVQLEDADHAQARFVVPEYAGKRTLWFELHVQDGVNPDVIARTHVDFDCDPAYAPLATGSVRKFPLVDVGGIPLPRGKWELSGTLALAPNDEKQGALATLRFEYGEVVAACVSLGQNGSHAGLRMFGQQRDSVETPWYEPEISGKRELGEWPANQPLAFEFAWDGHELNVRFGPPGERDKWPESPMPTVFPLSSRPKKFVNTVEGGKVALSDVQLVGR
jgi:hypothetical protein